VQEAYVSPFAFNPANKYRNKKVTVDGILFDSKKESQVYLDLKAQKEKNELYFERQVQFELIPAQRDESGKVIERACTYKADFVVHYPDGEIVVVDCKGARGLDQKYPIKRKLMRWVHKIAIKEI
jgi:hypothetical protein